MLIAAVLVSAWQSPSRFGAAVRARACSCDRFLSASPSPGSWGTSYCSSLTERVSLELTYCWSAGFGRRVSRMHCSWMSAVIRLIASYCLGDRGKPRPRPEHWLSPHLYRSESESESLSLSVALGALRSWRQVIGVHPVRSPYRSDSSLHAYSRHSYPLVLVHRSSECPHMHSFLEPPNQLSKSRATASCLYLSLLRSWALSCWWLGYLIGCWRTQRYSADCSSRFRKRSSRRDSIALSSSDWQADPTSQTNCTDFVLVRKAANYSSTRCSRRYPYYSLLESWIETDWYGNCQKPLQKHTKLWD